ncbi:peroxiredoxin (alkyl hydroperoxide reductase subunit C) [Methanofollis sp. W23]|uniref:peroxiredoxin n=1 Tax=Methanofollis sp. W23 TaxID=2817849 RepID=UPI001AE6DCF9|nr:peroxiredoxin [Methanofollis sp. W23]MBP2147023.1 peroxiredoxin (alkyl hydroperoxide reductase subunit C) [Methanofollis sp. W23]
MEEIHSLPILGEEAPDFEALTTHGPLKLSDLRGKWVVLFSHPADFTPVCTTEFIGLAEANDELQRLNVQLIGLSIDSVHSHLAWVRNIKEKMGVTIPFPVIADLDMGVARKFGMIHPGQSSTATVRTVFFIDPDGMMRAMIYYPLSNGRYIPEIVRLVKALQTSDRHGVATPANWQPGEKVVVPPPKTAKAMEEREKEGYDCKDWYLCFKEI